MLTKTVGFNIFNKSVLIMKQHLNWPDYLQFIFEEQAQLVKRSKTSR